MPNITHIQRKACASCARHTELQRPCIYARVRRPAGICRRYTSARAMEVARPKICFSPNAASGIRHLRANEVIRRHVRPRSMKPNAAGTLAGQARLTRRALPSQPKPWTILESLFRLNQPVSSKPVQFSSALRQVSGRMQNPDGLQVSLSRDRAHRRGRPCMMERHQARSAGMRPADRPCARAFPARWRARLCHVQTQAVGLTASQNDCGAGVRDQEQFIAAAGASRPSAGTESSCSRFMPHMAALYQPAITATRHVQLNEPRKCLHGKIPLGRPGG